MTTDTTAAPGNLADSARRTVPGDAVRPPAKLAHLVLRTAHFDEAVRWYELVLGAHSVFRNPMLAFLTYDDEHHRLALVNVGESAPEAPRGAPGLEHVAFTYASLDDLLATYRRLDAAGIRPAWCVNHGPTTSMYYEDPDGHQVELQVDNFASADELVAWFRTGDFAANPIGTPFDPALLLARYEAGADVAELVAPPGVGVAG